MRLGSFVKVVYEIGIAELSLEAGGGIFTGIAVCSPSSLPREVTL